MSWQKHFVECLYKIARDDDRASLAKLRRATTAGGKNFAGAAQVIARTLPADLKPWEEEDAYLLASLFALAPSEGGLPLALLLMREKEVRNSESLELRFTALLASTREDLPVHLRHAVGLVGSADQHIDWADLFEDLRRWGAHSETTQKKWARYFWGSNENQELNDNQGTNS